MRLRSLIHQVFGMRFCFFVLPIIVVLFSATQLYSAETNNYTLIKTHLNLPTNHNGIEPDSSAIQIALQRLGDRVFDPNDRELKEELEAYTWCTYLDSVMMSAGLSYCALSLEKNVWFVHLFFSYWYACKEYYIIPYEYYDIIYEIYEKDNRERNVAWDVVFEAEYYDNYGGYLLISNYIIPCYKYTIRSDNDVIEQFGLPSLSLPYPTWLNDGIVLASNSSDKGDLRFGTNLKSLVCRKY